MKKLKIIYRRNIYKKDIFAYMNKADLPGPFMYLHECIYAGRTQEGDSNCTTTQFAVFF